VNEQEVGHSSLAAIRAQTPEGTEVEETRAKATPRAKTAFYAHGDVFRIEDGRWHRRAATSHWSFPVGKPH
jgi:hypothetical protein